MTSSRSLPLLDDYNRFFWTSGAEGVLRILRCNSCKSLVHPPRPVCSSCLSEDLAPKTCAGTGVVETFTVNYQKWRPDLTVPYVIARVALDDAPGIILTTNIVNCPVESVDIGDPVRVLFEQHDDVWIPLFEKIV